MAENEKAHYLRIFVIQKIARQVEGEFIWVQAVAGFIEQTNAENFLKTYQYTPTETFNGVECIVELGTVQVDILDAAEFFGKPTGA